MNDDIPTEREVGEFLAGVRHGPDRPAVVSPRPDIPDEAVEAAGIVVAHYRNKSTWSAHDIAGAALVAAAPILTRQAVATLNGQWQAEQSEYIDRVLAAERERIATAIEALNPDEASRYDLNVSPGASIQKNAAAIARAGGTE